MFIEIAWINGKSSQCDFTTIKQLVKGYRIKNERNGEPLFVIDVILFLSKQNLSFRGHRENFDS